MFRKGLDNPTTWIKLLRPRLLGGLALVSVARGELEEAAKLVSEAA